MCGERQVGAYRGGIASGSSPRVRGTPRCRSCGVRRRRFIPACAGNARCATPGSRPSSVHPRVCGERDRNLMPAPAMGGSSPRVRGTLPVDFTYIAHLRFIPACAGNAGGSVRVYQEQSVHPRVCGERPPSALAGTGTAGSSPRVRGTLQVALRAGDHGRFIPACAGNAAKLNPTHRDSPVHPRVCGERARIPSTSTRRAGSSPRVRGTQAQLRAGLIPLRFIPACAGNAGPLPHGLLVRAVHPRVCGERALIEWRAQIARGSSPRVRGTRRGSAGSPFPVRFIPACAGNALSASSVARSRAVHPRVCGERVGDVDGARAPGGSSPRVRGTRSRR